MKGENHQTQPQSLGKVGDFRGATERRTLCRGISLVVVLLKAEGLKYDGLDVIRTDHETKKSPNITREDDKLPNKLVPRLDNDKNN